MFDFSVKLESLKSVWDSIVPGFHSWFVRKRAPIFQNQVVGEPLDRLQLDTRFTTNRLEVLHKIQKKDTTEANLGLEVTSVLKTLHQWYLSFERETEKAFYGQGKFGYEKDLVMNNFTENLQSTSFVEPRQKARSYEEISSIHTIITDSYKKPLNDGLKAPSVKKTRRNQDEAELFQDRIVVSAKVSVTPLKLRKAGDTGDWVVEKSNKPRYQGN